MPKGPEGEKRHSDDSNIVVAINAVFYNWLHIQKTLRVTPAMAGGLTDLLWYWEDLVAHDGYRGTEARTTEIYMKHA